MIKDHNTAGKVLKIMIAVVLSLILGGSAILFFYFRTPDMQYRHNLNLGNKYLLAMQYDDAVNAFTRAIDIEPKAADAYVGRGDAYAGLKQDEKAQVDYIKAVELDPELNDKIQEKVSGLDITPVPSPTSTPTPTEAPKTFGGVVLLSNNSTVEADLDNDGNVDRISCLAPSLGSDASTENMQLKVNDLQYSGKLPLNYFVKAFAADINLDDSYKNIVVVGGGDDGERTSVVYAYNENEILKINEFDGEAGVNGILGDGKVTFFSFDHWSSTPDGTVYFGETQMFQDLNFSEDSREVGHMADENDVETFVNGYSMTAISEIPLYSDNMYTQQAGSISPGETIQLTGNKYENTSDLYHYYRNYEIVTGAKKGWIDIGNNVAGYQGFA